MLSPCAAEWPLLDCAQLVPSWEASDRQPDRVQPGAAAKAGLLSQQHGGVQAQPASSRAPSLPQLD